jgi:elongation factor 1-gamma
MRHFETIVNQPKLKDVFGGDGKAEWVEKAIQFTPPGKK